MRHERTVKHLDKAFNCSHCDHKTVTRKLLKQHMTKAHGKKQGSKMPAPPPSHRCHLCEKKLQSKKALLVHEKHCASYQHKKFHCLHCSYGSDQRKEVARHLRVVHPNERNKKNKEDCKITCPFIDGDPPCQTRFQTIDALNRHLQLIHPPPPGEEQDDSEQEMDTPELIEKAIEEGVFTYRYQPEKQHVDVRKYINQQKRDKQKILEESVVRLKTPCQIAKHTIIGEC